MSRISATMVPWKPQQELDHRRLNTMQDLQLQRITVVPPLKMLRNGNNVVISLAEQRPQGGAVGIPKGEFEEMMLKMVTDKVVGYGYLAGHPPEPP